MRAILIGSALVALCFGIPTASSAAEVPTEVFGVTLGAPLSLPACPADTSGISLNFRTGEITSVSFPECRATEGVYFASGQKPRWVRYPFFDVDTTSGVVDEVTILTRGPEAQDLVLLEITEKFGPPTTKSIEHEQNGFGAKFDVINAVWKRADGVIDFISIVDPETGVITIKSKAFLAREQQEINAGAHL